MPRALVTTGMELEYDTFGSPDDPTLLLVMGFTAQMTAWDDSFCRLLADGGYHVVRFDNRDCGLSTKLDGQTVDLGELMTAVFSGQPVPAVPYTLSDMAADAIGLLDHLGIERAHIMGASMGGMIVQTMAIEHPARVRSMVSVMSMPGEPDVGQPAPEVAAVLLSPPATDRQGYIDDSPKWMVWQSKKYRDEQKVKENAAASFDRSFYPDGGPRQMAAIYASGARTEALQQLDVPTLVIHGRDDTLITPSGGLRTAELIPGAHLLLVADMGHDMPEPLWPLFVDSIHGHLRRAG
jgi:pimeloyl-ACP methyl ester carboxylesterase